MNTKKIMSKNTIAALACAFFVITAGCAMDRTMAKRAPAAQSPGIYRVIKPGPPEKVVVPNLRGEYELLPAKSVVIELNSQYLTDFQVDIDGDVLPLAENVDRQRDLEAEDMGYYTSKINTDLSTGGMANWQIEVFPPPSMQNGNGFNINIRSLSVSTKYTGMEKISSPLTILVARQTGREERRDTERRTEETLE